MAKQGMSRPDMTHTQPRNQQSPVPQIQGKAKRGKAKANSITTTGTAFPFREGDAVTISGCTVEPKNNLTIIIREISEDGKTLSFYENSFTIPEGEESVTETGAVTLARSVPDLDFICANEVAISISCCWFGS